MTFVGLPIFSEKGYHFSIGRKDFLPVEPAPQADLSFLFLLGALEHVLGRVRLQMPAADQQTETKLCRKIGLQRIRDRLRPTAGFVVSSLNEGSSCWNRTAA